MNIEKKLKDYKETVKIVPNEQNIEKTIKKSIDVFCSMEQERSLTYSEFLWIQLRMIRKRWWFFQLLLLSALWTVLLLLQGEQRTQRLMGVVASLFTILVIPELWKSQTYQSMEIESTSYFSLRQIYSSRLLLFGIVDIILVTFFCGLSFIVLHVTLSQILVQFIFPMVVTTCICFGILCSKYPFSEMIAVIMCIVWSTVWLLIVLNTRIYEVITFPLWLTFLGISLVFLVFTIYRTLYSCNKYWEVSFNGIDIR